MIIAVAVVIVGGIGSIIGTLIVAHIIGFMEIISTTLIAAELRGVFTMLLIIGVLVLRPRGLFGRRNCDMGIRWQHLALWAVFIIVMLALPEFVSKGTLRTIIFANFLAIFAISWDVLSGRTGYISFGHPFLVGIGAYTSAILSYASDFLWRCRSRWPLSPP